MTDTRRWGPGERLVFEPYAQVERAASRACGAMQVWRPTVRPSLKSIVIMHAGIGDTVRRKEDLRLVTGRGCYSDDFNLPGQAYAVVVRAPHAHALIRSIDAEAARAMPGVLAVLTGAQACADGLTRIPHLAAPGTPPDIVLRNRDGSPVPVAPHPVLPTDRVRHVGTAVALVIAETLAAAKDAAEKVIVEYEPLPVVTEGTAGAEVNAPRLYDDIPNVLIDAEVGDAAATAEAFARAAHVTRLDTWINRVTGVPMEPRAALGVYDAASGRYTLYAGSAASCARRRSFRKFSACRSNPCASSPARSAAISARATVSFPNSHSSPGARAASGGR